MFFHRFKGVWNCLGPQPLSSPQKKTTLRSKSQVSDRVDSDLSAPVFEVVARLLNLSQNRGVVYLKLKHWLLVSNPLK